MDFLLVQFHFTISLIKENQELAKLRDFLLPLFDRWTVQDSKTI